MEGNDPGGIPPLLPKELLEEDMYDRSGLGRVKLDLPLSQQDQDDGLRQVMYGAIVALPLPGDKVQIQLKEAFVFSAITIEPGSWALVEIRGVYSVTYANQRWLFECDVNHAGRIWVRQDPSLTHSWCEYPLR